MTERITVVKIGGNVIDDAAALINSLNILPELFLL